jgi:hypothetical protein
MIGIWNKTDSSHVGIVCFLICRNLSWHFFKDSNIKYRWPNPGGRVEFAVIETKQSAELLSVVLLFHTYIIS